MPRISETQLPAFHISHDIKTSREHGCVRLFENDGPQAQPTQQPVESSVTLPSTDAQSVQRQLR